MILKVLVAVPAIASITSVAVIDPALQQMHFVFAVFGASAGAYAGTAYEVFMMITARALPPYWKSLAALRVSISFLIGLFITLAFISKNERMNTWHEWETAGMSFNIAICGLLLIPLLQQLAKLRVKNQTGSNGE